MIAMAHQRVFYTGDVSLFQEVVGFSAEVVVSFFSRPTPLLMISHRHSTGLRSGLNDRDVLDLDGPQKYLS
jgi:hypothetical protein